MRAFRKERPRNGELVRRTAEQAPASFPPAAMVFRRPWLVGCILLWASSVALGCSRVGAHDPFGAAILCAFAGAAAIAIAAGALDRRPKLTTSALGLLALTFVSLAMLARGPIGLLLLAAANVSIAWRWLWLAIRLDRRRRAPWSSTPNALGGGSQAPPL